MARFAASQNNFDIIGPRVTGGPSTNVGDAASIVNLANTFGTFQNNGVKADSIAAQAMATRAEETAAAFGYDALVKKAKLAEKYGLDATMINRDGTLDRAEEESRQSFFQNSLKLAGTLGLGLLISDRSTKENIEAIDDALSTLRSLRPVTYNYKEEFTVLPERLHHGFIAQEYNEVMPDATYYDEEYGKYCIDTSELIGLLVRAVQQLETKLTRLEARTLIEA